MARALCLAFALGALGFGAGSAESASAQVRATASCRGDHLRLTIDTQGESSTTWIGVHVRNSGPTCSLSGVATLTIEQLGRPARVTGNPLKRPLGGPIRRGGTRLLRADWDNWCGSRRGLSLRVHYERVGLSARARRLGGSVERHTR